MANGEGRGNKYFDPLCDSFLSPEFSEIEPRVSNKRFEKIAAELGRVVYSEWNKNELGLLIHAASIKECEPSIRRLRDKKPHDMEVAVEVFSGLAGLLDRLMSIEVQNRIEQYAHEEHANSSMPHAHTVETAVLTAMWWLIANKKLDEKSYALPVVSELEKEKSGFIQTIFKTRTDLRFVDGQNGAKIDIQVKSKRFRGRPESTSKRPYAPWVPIITPLDFVNDGKITGYKPVEKNGKIVYYPKYEGHDGSLDRLHRAIKESKPEQIQLAHQKFSERLTKAARLHEAWWLNGGQEGKLAVNL